MKMASNKERLVGENALERVVRLLGRVNERFADPDVPGMEPFSVVLNADGRADVCNEETTLVAGYPLPRLVEFLEGSQSLQARQIAFRG